MPKERLIAVLPSPGVEKDSSTYAVSSRYIDVNNVRWADGHPEKIGGNIVHFDTTAFIGKARSEFAWRSDVGNRYLAIGTHKKLYALSDKTLYDITPVRASGTLGNNPFATVSGSAVVTVTHTAHGASEGDYVRFSGATAVGGITISGEYAITGVTGSDTYTITHSSAASSSATGGGAAVTYSYDITTGLEYPGYGAGWGVGTWGTGTWGTPRVSTNYRDARFWHFGNWGGLLIACPTGGNIYEWDPINPTNRAVQVTGSPEDNVFMFITAEKHIVAVGADGNPMMVMWSDIDDREDWTPADDSDAGFFPVSGGNRLVGAITFREGVNLVWTDTTLFAMQYTRTSDLFIFTKIAVGCGLLGPKAVVEYDGAIYWMSASSFHVFDGQLRHLSPNEVDDHVFHNLNRSSQSITFAGASVEHGEVWFWYPTNDGGLEVSVYAAIDVAEGGFWIVGDMVRTAWKDRDIFPYPLAAGVDGYIHRHETGFDDGDEPLPWHLQSGFIDSGEDDAYVLVQGVIPDFKTLDGRCQLYIYAKDAPQQEPETHGPFTIRNDSERIDFHASGKLISFRLEGEELGQHMRLGKMRFAIRTGGGRR